MTTARSLAKPRADDAGQGFQLAELPEFGNRLHGEEQETKRVNMAPRRLHTEALQIHCFNKNGLFGKDKY